MKMERRFTSVHQSMTFSRRMAIAAGAQTAIGALLLGRLGRLAAFARRLEELGIPVAVRQPRGKDIAAACGQLKAEATQGRAPVRITPRETANR